MGQRVGANQKQFHKIKKMLEEGVPQSRIAETFNIEPQSLEKICAHIEGREEVRLVLQDNPEMNLLMAENARLKAALGEPEDGEETEGSDSEAEAEAA